MNDINNLDVVDETLPFTPDAPGIVHNPEGETIVHVAEDTIDLPVE